MAFLKINKAELVNRSYSLKREIIGANRTGAYCNTTIVCCNTRRYHGLFAVTLDRFGGDKYMLLSSLDESIIIDGKRFNLGIHCYGDVYYPRGHKYVVNFEGDPLPCITYKVGDVLFRKTILLVPDKDRLMIKYEVLESPSGLTLQLMPFLSFRNVHALTSENSEANLGHREIENGEAFNMYKGFPDLCLQFSSSKKKFVDEPSWNKGITYPDEYRRGFDCVEDLFVPGYYSFSLKSGESLVFSASMYEENCKAFKKEFTEYARKAPTVANPHELLTRWADKFVCVHNGKKQITAGFSWLYTGLLRETLIALPGLTLYGVGGAQAFEEILDNLLADNQERLFRRTTQVEAPLMVPVVLQEYIDSGADPAAVWKKYGKTVKGILESYLPGVRQEIAMQPNGLLWAQLYSRALTWMNAYVNGSPVTERAGFQVETNAFWYNAICFALEMEKKYGKRGSGFTAQWTDIKKLVEDNYQPTFWDQRLGCLADYVDGYGRNMRIRPNQIMAIAVKYSPVDEALFPSILRIVDAELLTSRGIRSLSPRDPDYKGVYEGSQHDRDLAYHQGCAFPFLLMPYCRIAFKVKGAAFYKKSEWLVEGFYDDFGKHGVCAFSELYDGDPPQAPHGAVASALSTAALLTIDHIMKKYKEDEK
ncbi:MAG: glycogen debranching enzyme family protein [Bacteroidales bacterium]|nr:glycogen debranching enzyme family protein [Bacteroidales bacterium]